MCLTVAFWVGFGGLAAQYVVDVYRRTYRDMCQRQGARNPENWNACGNSSMIVHNGVNPTLFSPILRDGLVDRKF